MDTKPSSAPYEDEYCVPANSGRPVAREWLSKNGARIHRGLAPPSGYDTQRAQSPRKSQDQEVDVFESHTEHFNTALAIYQSSNKGILKDLDVRRAHGWDEISRLYQDAQLKYAEKGKGWLGFPRKLGRSTGDNAPSVVYPWLNFIPDGTYTTMLKAGLFLIFGAATRLSERRQKILETFGKIPFLVQDAEYSFEDFYNDGDLRKLIIDLYLSILQTVMAMMEWLVEKAGCRRLKHALSSSSKGPADFDEGKQIKALIHGPGYAKSLDDMIDNMQKQMGAIDRCVSKLTRGAIVSTFASAKQTAIQVGKLSKVAETIKEDTGEVKTATSDIKGDTSEIKLSVHTLEANIDEKHKSNEKAYSHILNLLDEQKRNSEWNQKGWQEAEKRREELEKSEKLRQDTEKLRLETESKLQLANAQLEYVHHQQGMIVKSDELLEILGVNPRQIITDIDDTIRGGQILDYAVQGRGHMLMQDPKFQAWLSSAQSRALLVDGNAESSMERISAMSVVCALLAQSLPNQTASTIAYFCGMRAGQDDGVAGPVNLVRNLLAQLIHNNKFDTIFSRGRAYRELEHFDVRRLCLMLVEMVKKLPHGAVLFCIVDGISWLEEEERSQEMCFIVQTLSGLVRDPEVRAVFKLLVTSPLACRHVAEYFPTQDCLSLLHEVAESDGTPMTTRQVMLQSPDARADPFEEVIHDIDSDEGYDDGGFDEGTILDDD